MAKGIKLFFSLFIHLLFYPSAIYLFQYLLIQMAHLTKENSELISIAWLFHREALVLNY